MSEPLPTPSEEPSAPAEEPKKKILHDASKLHQPGIFLSGVREKLSSEELKKRLKDFEP